MLSDRLIELFPGAVVTMEEIILETNQRSDVLLKQNGEVWAFEFQCSVITADTWAERHCLYEKADIIDFWVLGESIHSYGISDKREDKSKHRLGGLEKAIFEKYKRVHYLDTASGKMRILGQFKYELSNTILKCRTHYNMLRNLAIRNHTWWTSEDAWEEKLRQEKEHERRYKTDPAYKAEYDKMIHDKYFKPVTSEDFLKIFPDSYTVSSDSIKIINEKGNE